MTTQQVRAGAGSEATTQEPGVLSRRQIRVILIGLLLGMFLSALDQNIVSVAIVRISNSLHGFDKQAWATTAYLIAGTITTPLYGKLADLYGRKPFYLLAIVLFVIGSAACTFATSMYELAGFRAFQGLGAGGLMPLAFTIIGDSVPARERVRYQGFFIMVFGVCTILGPVLGGWFSGYDHLWGLEGWRWIFLVNVPIGVIALGVVAKVLPARQQRHKHRIDWLGAIGLVIGVVPLLIVAEQGRGWGWDSQKALVCYAVAVVGLVLFLIAETLMKNEALIPLRLFGNRTTSFTFLGGFMVGVAMFGSIAIMPLYLQVARGYSPTKAGLLMLPPVLGLVISSVISGKITNHTGRYKMLPVLGTFIIAVGAVLYARVHYDSPLWQPLVIGAVMGFGLGGCMQTLITAAQNAGSPSELGVSTATATFCRQMGGTLGVAVFLTILFNVLPHRITRAFGGQLPLGFDSHRLDEVQSDTSGIAHLPDAIRVPLLIGVTDSLHVVFCAIALSALVGTVVLLFMKEIPLQGDSGAHNTVAGLDSAAEPIGDRPGTHLVYGRIRRSDTFPVAGAVLTLIDYRGHQVARATSDSAGRYRITAPRPGNYVLIASANQYQPTALNISLSEWQHIQDLVLSGSGEVSGVVWSSGQGEVVSGAAVTVTDERGEVVGAALSDHEGRYVCRGISAGTYTLVAVSEHLRPYATSLVVPEGGLRNFVIELTALAELAGAVWANGRCVPDALVTIVDSTGKPVAATRTDEDGNYLIPDLEEGEYTVVARGYPPMTSRVTISDRRHDHNILLGYPEITPPETNSEITEASNVER